MGDYRKYLASKDWKQTRAYRVALAGGRCEECGADRVLQAHHNTYNRVERELLDDLDVLCRPCHMREHGTQPKERPMSATNGAVTETIVETAPAAVTIRTLSVRGSSMTLAVYRQLPERELIDADEEFCGTPWGTVNLCPSRDCPSGGHTEHFHVVWEDDGQLYRDTIQQDLWRYSRAHDAAPGLAALIATHGPTRAATNWTLVGESETYGLSLPIAEGIDAVWCRLPPGMTRGDFLTMAEPPPCDCGCLEDVPSQFHSQMDAHHSYECAPKEWQKAENAVRRVADEACEEWSMEHPKEFIERIRKDMTKRHNRGLAWAARWNELEALPQLFLGV